MCGDEKKVRCRPGASIALPRLSLGSGSSVGRISLSSCLVCAQSPVRENEGMHQSTALIELHSCVIMKIFSLHCIPDICLF